MDAFRELAERCPDPILIHRGHECCLFRNAAFDLAFPPGQVSWTTILEELDSPAAEVRAVWGRPQTKHRVFKVSARLPLQVQGEDCQAIYLRDVTELQDVQDQLVRVSSSEKNKFAAELHDGLGQELAAVTLEMHVLGEEIEKQLPREKENASRISQALGAIGKRVRSLAHSLTPAVSKQTIGTLLTKIARDTFSDHGVSCICRVERDLVLPPELTLNLQRIAQEAVANARRHGKARSIVIRIGVVEGAGALSISDDGRGLPLELQGSGIGLQLMEHRAQQIGGSVRITPQQPAGTKVECTFPLPSCP